MNLRRISEVHHLPVLDLETGDMLGEIVSWIVSPTHNKILAYILTRQSFWKKASVIVPADILEYAPKMVVVRDKESIIDPQEIVGLIELMGDSWEVVGFQAVTETGKVLGRVADLVFETISSSVYQYQIEPVALVGGWQDSLTIPANRVIRIEKNRLIFPDDILANVKLTAQPQTQTS